MKHIKLFENFGSVTLLNTQDFTEFEPILSLKSDLGEEFIDAMREYCGLDYESHYEDHPSANTPNWRVYIIKSNNQPAGVIGMYRINGIKNEYWLGWFGVLPEYRGTEVARESVNILISNIKEENSSFDRLLVYTEDNNYRAQGFYKKVGFKYLSTVDEYCQSNNILKDKYFTDDTEDIVMYKNI